MGPSPYRTAQLPEVTRPICVRAYPILCYAWAFRWGADGWDWLRKNLGPDAVTCGNLTDDERTALDFVLDWMPGLDFSRCVRTGAVCGQVISDQCIVAQARRCR